MDVVKKIEVNKSNISYMFKGLKLVKNSKIHFEVVPNHIRSRWPLMMHHPWQAVAPRPLVSTFP